MATTGNGVSYIVTFPFPIYVDEKLPPAFASKASIEGAQLRIYRPFRSAPWNFRPVPAIAYNQVPFLPNSQPLDTRWRHNSVPVVHMDIVGGTVQIALDVPNKPPKREYLAKLPQDSLRLDVYSKLPKGLDFAVSRWTNYLMELVRWHSRQWWISRSLDAISTGSWSTFPVSEKGKPIGRGEGFLDFSLQGFDEKLVNFTIWRQAIDDFNCGVEVPEQEVLLMDAVYLSAKRDFRRCVIDAATAVEQAKDTTFQRLWVACKTEPFNRDKVLGRWDISNHLDVKLKHNFGRSYKEDFPAAWEIIHKLWDARGNIGHGGKNVYGDPPVAVDDKFVLSFLKTAEHCIRWLEKL